MIAGAITLAACSGTRELVDERVPLPQSWRNLLSESRTLSRPARSSSSSSENGDSARQGDSHTARDFDAKSPASRWWATLNNHALVQLIDSVLASNLTVGTALQRLHAERAMARASKNYFLPQLSINAGSATSPDARADYYQAGFDAAWELPLFERGAIAMRASAARTDAAGASLAAARSTVTAEVVSVYLAARAAQLRSALLATLIQQLQSQLDRVHTRIRQGFSSASQEQTARTGLVSAQLRATASDAQIEQSLQRMASLTGQPAVDPSWLPTAEDLPLQYPHVESAPADVIRRRPDVRTAEAEVLIAAATLEGATADMYPHVSLTGAITAAARISGVSLSQVHSVAGAAPEISIPLFDWGMRRAMRDARAHELKAAALSYRQVVVNAVAEVESALAHVNQTFSSLGLLRSALDNDQLSSHRAAARRRAGLDDVDESATARVLETQLSVVEAEFDCGMALVQLYKALGDTGDESSI